MRALLLLVMAIMLAACGGGETASTSPDGSGSPGASADASGSADPSGVAGSPDASPDASAGPSAKPRNWKQGKPAGVEAKKGELSKAKTCGLIKASALEKAFGEEVYKSEGSDKSGGFCTWYRSAETYVSFWSEGKLKLAAVETDFPAAVAIKPKGKSFLWVGATGNLYFEVKGTLYAVSTNIGPEQAGRETATAVATALADALAK